MTLLILTTKGATEAVTLRQRLKRNRNTQRIPPSKSRYLN
jgi:hypothetical protein